MPPPLWTQLHRCGSERAEVGPGRGGREILPEQAPQCPALASHAAEQPGASRTVLSRQGAWPAGQVVVSSC